MYNESNQEEFKFDLTLECTKIILLLFNVNTSTPFLRSLLIKFLSIVANGSLLSTEIFNKMESTVELACVISNLLSSSLSKYLKSPFFIRSFIIFNERLAIFDLFIPAVI